MQTERRNDLRALLRLTRWKEHLPFTIPLTMVGALLTHQPLDWRLAAVTLANVLAVSYAFMINDIEDAPDDAHNPERAARNAVTCGEVTPRFGWWVSLAVGTVAAVLYITGGLWVLVIGTMTVALSHTYSWKRIRLKAWPVVDVISHSLMLSGLLVMAGFFIYDAQPGWAWLVVLALVLFSVYGQLYNQLRDYAADKAAGLNNTAIIAGEPATRVLIVACVTSALVLVIASVVVEIIPAWFMLTLVGVFALAMLRYHRIKEDMRGTVAADASGRAQVPAIIAVNASTLVWLVYALRFDLLRSLSAYWPMAVNLWRTVIPQG